MKETIPGYSYDENELVLVILPCHTNWNHNYFPSLKQPSRALQLKCGTYGMLELL